ncbi:MAG: hypothetical protein HZC28_15385 [Spirochaetes bacterium]|nr:hypothetical protein [Spirochaetota bacterium]
MKRHSIFCIAGALSLALSFLYAGELPVENADFETAITVGDKRMPALWNVSKWGGSAAGELGIVEGSAASGNFALSITPSASGGIGFSSREIALPKEFTSVVLTLRVKAVDLVKNTPWAFISWHKNGKFINKKEVSFGTLTGGEWKQMKLTVDRAEIPAEANSFYINLAAFGNESGSGSILYDAVALASTVPDSAPAAASPESLVPNAGFESASDDAAYAYPQPSQWVITRWTAKNDTKDIGVTSDEASSGKRSLAIRATELGGVGYSSPAIPIPDNFKFFTADIAIKASQDCGAVPWVFIAWYRGGQFLGRSDLPAAAAKGAWQTVSVEVSRSEIPKDADSFRINCAVNGMTKPSGTIFFDDARVAVSRFRKNFRLTASAPYGWFEGAPVRFTCEDAPGNIMAVKGTIFDTLGTRIAEVSVPREKFLKDGWTWTAPSPGYYEIVFEYSDNGMMKPVTRSFNMRSKSGAKNFDRDRYSVAVVKKRASTARSDQFGFDHQSDSETALRLAETLGLGYVRMWVNWGYHWKKSLIINPSKGVFNWEPIDREMEKMQRYGFRNNIFTIFGTPSWASPYPDANEIDIHVPRYSVWLPRDISSWTDFVSALVGRYQDRIVNWELWNEPHLPTGSIYWRDTTANYVKLVKSGYETIKSLQPNSIVWLGGQGGRRYIPFYKEFLSEGGFPYYDVLAMHGSFPEAKLFWELEQQRGLTPKPWGSTEWHAVLINMSIAGNKLSTEAELGRRMMTDILQQLKYGAQRIALFEILNLDEKETLSYASANGIFTHTSGMFRQRPEIEPRFAGVIIRNFLDRIDTRIGFVREYDLGTQKAVLLTNGGKPFLVVWNEGTETAALDARLAKAIPASAAAVSWEGKPWNDRMLDATAMYYITGIEEKALAAIDAPASALLYPIERKKIVGDANALKGVLSPAPLFDDVNGSVNPAVAWNTSGWVFKSTGNAGRPEGFKARFASYCSASGIDLVVEVSDRVFVQNEKPGFAYNGDCVQFALDAAYSGANGDQTEMSVALSPDGVIIWKHMASAIGGDIPQNWTGAGRAVKYAKAAVEKSDGRMVYKIHADWSEFYPFVYDPKKPVRLSVLVNNNNGNGRIGWLEWGGGIGESKDPSQFGKLELR